MIYEKDCHNCQRAMRVWIPFSEEVNKQEIIVTTCELCKAIVDFSYVLNSRKSQSIEEKELQQLSYLQRKYR